MSEENKAIVRAFFERLSSDQAIPEDLLGPGFAYTVAGNPPLDLEGTRARIARFDAGFSAIHHRIEDLVAEGDRVAFRSTLSLTHSGDFMGTAGMGERIAIVEMGFFRIADARIVEMWGLLDLMGLFQQLGVQAT